jgi:hypothetical protein
MASVLRMPSGSNRMLLSKRRSRCPTAAEVQTKPDGSRKRSERWWPVRLVEQLVGSAHRRSESEVVHSDRSPCGGLVPTPTTPHAGRSAQAASKAGVCPRVERPLPTATAAANPHRDDGEDRKADARRQVDDYVRHEAFAGGSHGPTWERCTDSTGTPPLALRKHTRCVAATRSERYAPMPACHGAAVECPGCRPP